MLVSGVVGTDAHTATQQQTIQATSSSNISIVKVAEADSIKSVDSTTVKAKKLDKNADIESKVRLYFADMPIMAEVVKCESQFRQFSTEGSGVFRGIVNNQDVGIAQINEYYHAKRAKKLGYDIYTVEGNMAYARLLYKEEGTDPWISSSPCWSKSEVAKAMNAQKKVLADNLSK